jgi:hypothetical protein
MMSEPVETPIELWIERLAYVERMLAEMRERPEIDPEMIRRTEQWRDNLVARIQRMRDAELVPTVKGRKPTWTRK